MVRKVCPHQKIQFNNHLTPQTVTVEVLGNHLTDIQPWVKTFNFTYIPVQLNCLQPGVDDLLGPVL